MQIISAQDRKGIERLLAARQAALGEAERVARRIIADVRRTGDRALADYARRFDGVNLKKAGLTVSAREIRQAYRQVPRGFVPALRQAARNIARVAREQLPREWRVRVEAGIEVGQVVRPLERVACYVPGGRYPLPSTVLMSVIPAQTAGVREIYLACPRPAPAVLVAADLLGVSKIFRLGGAQAVAAFALGTRSVPRVDKIVGPGNRYVAAAKKLLAGECGIDFVAGPSELVVLATRGNPRWIAADLVAQAEHDTDAVAILITTSTRLARQVQVEAARRVRSLNAVTAEQSLARCGGIITTRNLTEALALSNRIAPEHLTLLGPEARLLAGTRSAGSIFLGEYSPVAAGDYAAGSNHILPTSGMARLRGGLSAADFAKTLSVQRLTRQGLGRLRRTVTILARAEGLEAHAQSVETRFGAYA